MRGEPRVKTVNDVTMSRCTWGEGPLVRGYMTVRITLLGIFYRCTVPLFLFDYTVTHGSAQYRTLLTGL